MKKRLRLLLIEDSDWDAELLLTYLKKGGYELEFKRIQTVAELRENLHKTDWDVILADYNLPQFSALAALEVVQKSGLDIPFIIVSGAIGEDTASAAMKAGAHDYLMKNNLARLVPAVERELREAENRAGRRRTNEALRESELRYRLLWETATDAIILIDPESRIHFANPAVQEIFGYRPDELIGQSLAILQPESLRKAHRAGLSRYLRTSVKRLNWRATETTAVRKDGTEIPVEVAFSDMELQGKRWFVGFIRDVTDRKVAERELHRHEEQFRVAREIQQHLFPKAAPELPGLEVAGASFPAEATGGDYFDYLLMGGQCLGVVVGDVTGHGVGPALLMAETRAYLRLLAKSSSDAGEILTRANLPLAEDLGIERFVTVLFVRIDPASRQLTYANAGHPTGYILAADGQIKKELRRTGVPLGIRPDVRYESSAPILLAGGEIVVLLTDGFEETVDADDVPYGIERALDVVRTNSQAPAEQIVKLLYESAQAYSQNTAQLDDLTAIIIKVK